jgi:hypothetical protein
MKKLTVIVALAAGLGLSSNIAMAESYDAIKKSCNKYASEPAECIDQKVSFAFKDLYGQLQMLKLKEKLNVGDNEFKHEVLILKTQAKEKLANGEDADIVLGELINDLNRIIEIY